MTIVKKDDAVSPVIGVILMVAITVILAAVIAAFVFGMAGNVGKTKNVAVTTQKNNGIISVTYQGGQDAGEVGSFTWTIDGETQSGATGTVQHTLAATVGATAVNMTGGSAPNTSSKNHVIVTATFKDSTSQVVLDTYV